MKKNKLGVLCLMKVLAVMFTVGLLGCGSSGNSETEIVDPKKVGPEFSKFQSKAEFNEYIQIVEDKKKEQSSADSSGSSGTQSPQAVVEGSPEAPTTTSPSGQSDKVETNNQQKNVDEGDIIKFSGDHMIILRDQHLLSLDISGEHASKPVVISDKELDADFGQGAFSKGAWYDEMLVFDSKVILLALRYHVNIVSNAKVKYPEYATALEILEFDLAKDGQLKQGKRVFIESADYYSGATNYATRKIGNKLIIYSPFYVVNYIYDNNDYSSRRRENRIPCVLEIVNAGQKLFRRVRPAMDYTDIYRGTYRSAGNLIHSVYVFDIERGIDLFKPAAVMGDYASTYYVTDKNFYLNIGRWWWDDYARDRQKSRSMLYQIKLGDEVQLNNIAEIEGAVPERFAMSETENSINVITKSHGSDESVRAISLDIEDFSKIKMTSVPSDQYVSSVRFNNDHAVIAFRNYSGKDNPLFLADFGGEEPKLIKTSLGANNIELMQPYGDGNWITLGYKVSQTGDANEFGWYDQTYTTQIGMLKLDDQDEVAMMSSFEIAGKDGWSESFRNDHAFYFDPVREIIGFPYTTWGQDYRWSEGVNYFSFKNDALTKLGDEITADGDRCQECWYGNSRVVRSDDFYYNLLGRQLKVSMLDEEAGVMKEVSTMELFEQVILYDDMQ